MKVLEELAVTKQEGMVTYIYTYRLTCSDFSISADNSVLKFKTYGIEAERKDFKQETVTDIERSSILNISPYRHKVKELLNLVFKNTVSPIHLVDVLGSYVDECACDFQQNSIAKTV